MNTSNTNSTNDWIAEITSKVIARSIENPVSKQAYAENFTKNELVMDMLSKVPTELWVRPDLKVLDPCCGVGNFEVGILSWLNSTRKPRTVDDLLDICEKSLYLCEIQNNSLDFTINILNNTIAHSKCGSFLDDDALIAGCKYDLIVGNPPYEDSTNGERKAKNHNLYSKFIEKSVSLLKPDGYLLFVVPPSWMSLSSFLMKQISNKSVSLLYADIGVCSKHFNVGSKFSYFLIKNTVEEGCPTIFNYNFKGTRYLNHFNGTSHFDDVSTLGFIPEFPDYTAMAICKKVLGNDQLDSIGIKFDSDLHAGTHKKLLSKERSGEYVYDTVHTPSQTLFSSRPHKHYGVSKLMVPITTHIEKSVVSKAGVTQCMGYVLCETEEEAENMLKLINLKAYRFVIGITRWGNFNSPAVLRKLRYRKGVEATEENSYTWLNLTRAEVEFLDRAFK